MVRFLAGPEGRYVTGQAIHMSGGMFFENYPDAVLGRTDAGSARRSCAS